MAIQRQGVVATDYILEIEPLLRQECSAIISSIRDLRWIFDSKVVALYFILWE
jgi:hypothetical protein